MKRTLAAVLCLSITGVVAATDFPMTMSVEQAYSAIPHERTKFLRALSRTQAADAAYLDSLFTLVDLAVVERVQTLLWIQTDGRRGAKGGNYGLLLEELSALEVPRKLHRVHGLITEALEEQQAYLECWRRARGGFDASNQLVQSSHGKLYKAYQILMQTYPREAAHNRKAFFDHLCALDFI